MKKALTLLLALSMVVGCLAGCGGSADSDKAADSSANTTDSSAAADNSASADAQQWNIGTSSSGQFYYSGVAIGEVVTPKVESFGLKIFGESTNGSVENCRRLGSGELQLAFSGPDNMVDEINAGNVNAEDVTLICTLFNNYWQFCSVPGQGTNASDLVKEGVKFGIGEPGTGLQSQCKLILDTFGLTVDDIEAYEISQADSVDGMIDGKITCAHFGGGLPYTHCSNLDSSLNGGVTLLNWTEEEIAKLNETNPFLQVGTVPGGTYSGTPDDVTTPVWTVPLFGRADLDEDLVYEFVKALMSSTEELAKIYPSCAEICNENALQALDAYEAAGIKLHPGAERYFKEIGMLD